MQKLKEAFANGKGRDGSRRIQKELAENGDSHNVKTIAASMKRQDLTPKATRKFKCTTDSKHKMSVDLNLLAQDFNATPPNRNGQEISRILPQAKASCIWLSLLTFMHDK